MNNKLLYVVIVLLLVIIAGGAYFLFGGKSGTPTPIVSQPQNSPAGAPRTVQEQPTSPTPTAPVPSGFSEEPNQAKYDEYLTDIYLGKMSIGKKIGADGFPTKTNLFTSGADQFCTMMTLKKTIASGHTAIAIYDVVARKDNMPKTVFPMELRAGGSGGCSDLTQSTGKYEYKLYIDDILASVLPFEVK